MTTPDRKLSWWMPLATGLPLAMLVFVLGRRWLTPEFERLPHTGISYLQAYDWLAVTIAVWAVVAAVLRFRRRRR